jgi:hypothetical protein
MKKALLIFALATVTSAAFAQSSSSKFHFGVKAQPALGWFRIDAPDNVNLKSDGLPFGFGYGLITDFGFTDHYSFSTGLEVAYRGGKTKFSYSDLSGNTIVEQKKYSLQFIELPITLKLRTKEIGYMTYYFQVGVAPGYAIRTRAEVRRNDVVIANNADVGSDINEFNLSMIIGAGAEYNISGTTSLLFGLTFNNGFLDILDDSAFGNSKVKGNSNYLALTVGIMF